MFAHPSNDSRRIGEFLANHPYLLGFLIGIGLAYRDSIDPKHARPRLVAEHLKEVSECFSWNNSRQ